MSPREQRERIGSECERAGLVLLDILEEPNVSGGAPLERRHGLRQAVERVEAGEADVIVVAYFDRLVRKLTVQAEVVERAEKAGGRIVAVDVGEVRADTASRWLSSTMLGMVAEYHRRATDERTIEAKRRAVERGVPPFAKIPPGYRRRADRTIEPHPKHAPVIAEAYRMRAEGATVMDVRAYLRQHGIRRSFHGTTTLLASRFYLGEIVFGDLSNPTSHQPIVDAAVWQRVQNIKVPRGRRAKSDRLLARLGVLRCGTCGSRMVVGSTDQKGTRHWFYRCPPVGDCPQRVTVSANLVEKIVIEAVQERIAGMRGTATMDSQADEAERKLERCEQELNAAVRAFTGLEDVDAARERLAELRQAREQARDRVDELRAATAPTVTITAGDWEDLSPDGRRALVRAVVERVDVLPGRDPSRITVQFRGE